MASAAPRSSRPCWYWRSWERTSSQFIASLSGVVPEVLAQHGPRPGQAGLHGAHRTADDLGHLDFGQILEIEQNDCPRLFRECHQRPLDFLAHDLSQSIQLDVATEPDLVGRCGNRWRHRVQASDRRIVALPAVETDEGIAEDAEQPRLE